MWYIKACVIQHAHIVTFPHHLSHSFPSFPGGAKQREAKLGTPKWRPPCPDYSGRHTGQGWDQDEESSRGGQEAPRTCCEYLIIFIRVICTTAGPFGHAVAVDVTAWHPPPPALASWFTVQTVISACWFWQTMCNFCEMAVVMWWAETGDHSDLWSDGNPQGLVINKHESSRHAILHSIICLRW